MVPADAVPQMEDIGRVVQLLPPFGHMRLDDEGARDNLRADFVPDQRTVHEAQGDMRLGVDREMRVKVGRIIAPDAQDAPALGWPGFRTPERGGVQQWPGSERETSYQTGLQHVTTIHPLEG